MTQFLRYIVLAAFSFGWAIPLCIALRFFGEWRHKVSPFSTTPRPNTDSFPYLGCGGGQSTGYRHLGCGSLSVLDFSRSKSVAFLASYFAHHCHLGMRGLGNVHVGGGGVIFYVQRRATSEVTTCFDQELTGRTLSPTSWRTWRPWRFRSRKPVMQRGATSPRPSPRDLPNLAGRR
jgi:hypothetical protein